jgi:hypothetical protein
MPGLDAAMRQPGGGEGVKRGVAVPCDITAARKRAFPRVELRAQGAFGRRSG